MYLCLSHTRDFYTIDIVQQHLAAMGEEVYRLNTDLFSDRIQFNYRQENGQFVFEIDTGEKKFTSADVSGVWYRKLWHIPTPPALDVAYHKIFYQEYMTMRDIFFDALAHVPWINAMPQDHHIGGNKALQLQMAMAAGLHTPESLFTNNAAAVRTFFYETCRGNMIAKLHGTLSRSMDGSGAFLPTTQVQEADLDRLDTLRYCPMIFQELIPKQYELRVIYVNGTFFTGKIDTQNTSSGKTDWRATQGQPVAWQAYSLPAAVAASIHGMMQQMGLHFGALDMIRHTDGRYIFLEVNPQGEWGMLQRDLHYPVGETIAATLAALAKNNHASSARAEHINNAL